MTPLPYPSTAEPLDPQAGLAIVASFPFTRSPRISQSLLRPRNTLWSTGRYALPLIPTCPRDLSLSGAFPFSNYFGLVLDSLTGLRGQLDKKRFLRVSLPPRRLSGDISEGTVIIYLGLPLSHLSDPRWVLSHPLSTLCFLVLRGTQRRGHEDYRSPPPFLSPLILFFSSHPFEDWPFSDSTERYLASYPSDLPFSLFRPHDPREANRKKRENFGPLSTYPPGPALAITGVSEARGKRGCSYEMFHFPPFSVGPPSLLFPPAPLLTRL